MNVSVSDDIKAVIEWEIAHGNAVEEITHPFGLPVVSMKMPVNPKFRGAHRDANASLTWWEFRDPHYGEAEWCAGFESTESGHKVCGPLK